MFAASIFADEVLLEDCIVIGGVFASRSLEMNNCIVGTFNCPTIRISKIIQLLLPSAFSVEKISPLPGTEMYNLSLADLGALYKGATQSQNSGRIKMNLDSDESKTVLTSEESQQILRSYSVIGKVLAADLIDIDKFQNHFLLSAAGLGTQLLRTYDLGIDKEGKNIELTVEKIADFFFNILNGKIDIQEMEGNFTMSEIINKFN